MYIQKRKLLSQNFLHSRKLVAKLLGNSSIGKNDLVLEIGPGKGIITGQLVRKARHIIAIELDKVWYTYLLFNKFNTINNLTLYQCDFLNFKLPALPYKVFANIPFAIEGKIIRKLIDSKNPPEDCYLIIRKELAHRLCAPYKENMFSIMHKPWFRFTIDYQFKRTDFTPIPGVGAALFHFVKRKEPLLSVQEKTQYQNFVSTGFGHGLPVFRNLLINFGKIRMKRILNKLQIPRTTRPGELTLSQWINLYEETTAGKLNLSKS